ncbi:MAG: hypothetical protein C4K49_02365 [Candidatus Thorarchaeota archaeon]|nr:MAG: hypothetical protein C4K49_02365 [Candidatus Thorarchaeota archaeon]
MQMKQGLLKLVGAKRFPLWGIAGSVVGLVFVLGAMIPYVGRNGEPFSIFNHFISELGEVGVSELSIMFNVGLIYAGVLFIPFMIGLGLYMDNIIAKLAAVVGVFSSVAIIFVGIFPENFLAEHTAAAMSFFLSGMVMTGLWTLAILLQHTSKVHKALSIVGLLNVVVFAAFLFGDYGDIGSLVDRPDFWMLPTLEWAIYFAVIGYLLLISVYVWRKEKGASSNQS